MFQVGYKFNSYVAVEGRYWFGGNDTIGTFPDAYGIPRQVDYDVDTFAVYVKPMYPVTDSFDVYALLGYANTDTDSYLDHDQWDDGQFSWGVGVAFSFTDNIGMFVDYTLLYDNDEDINLNNLETTVNAINFGLTYSF